jgi:hypothetical protein
MNRWRIISVWAAACAIVFVLTGGCRKSANDQDAIRASIEKRLNGRTDLNLSVMDRQVKQVSVNGDQATAQVQFHLKGSDAHMDIEYTLERKGKDWVVLSSQPVGMGNAHSGTGQAPESTPASGPLPQGHPPVNQHPGDK